MEVPRKSSQMKYGEFLELIKNNPDEFSVTCREEDFEVWQHKSTEKYFYLKRDNDCLQDAFMEVEIVAELEFTDSGILRVDNIILPCIIEAFCCGKVVDDNRIKILWFEKPKFLNTQITYMYRDAANYKTIYEIVVEGRINDKQKEAILNACDSRTYFIPRAIGLDGGLTEMDTDYDPDLDHPWCELTEDSFSLTRKAADSGFTIEELVEAFKNTRTHWEN